MLPRILTQKISFGSTGFLGSAYPRVDFKWNRWTGFNSNGYSWDRNRVTNDCWNSFSSPFLTLKKCSMESIRNQYKIIIDKIIAWYYVKPLSTAVQVSSKQSATQWIKHQLDGYTKKSYPYLLEDKFQPAASTSRTQTTSL